MPSTAPSSSVFAVANRIQDKTGYWGIPDATHQFCEPHYAFSPYAAEALNALSSLVFVLAAGMAYSRIYKRQDMGWMKLACFWLAVTGVGSTLFHGTMRRSMQLLDEGPMIGFIVTCTAWKMDKLPLTKPKAHFYRVLLGSAVAGLLLFYLIIGNYEVFLHGVTFLISVEIVTGINFRHVGEKRNGILAILGITAGRAFWEIENRYCETMPFVWPFHIIWHILACLAAYNLLLFNISLAKGKDVRHLL